MAQRSRQLPLDGAKGPNGKVFLDKGNDLNKGESEKVFVAKPPIEDKL